MRKLITATLLLMLFHIAIFAQGTTEQTRNMTKNEEAAYQAKFAKMRAKEDSISQIDLTTDIKNAQYIFEGIIIEAKQSGQGIANQIIKIHKVFKGNLACGTVKIISSGGNIRINDTLYMGGKGYGALSKGTSAIFLCNTYTSSRSNNLITAINPDNQIVLQINKIIRYDLDYPGTFESLTFDTYKKVYDRLLQEPSSQVEKCDSMDYQKHRDSITEAYYKKYGGRNKKPLDNKADTLPVQTPNTPLLTQPKQKGPNNQEGEGFYNYSRNMGHGPNNEGNDAFFLPEPEPVPEPPTPVPMSFTSDGLLYWLNITSVDSTNKAVNFDIEVENENGDDTFYLASANIYLHLNDSSLAGAHLSVSWVLGADYNQYGITTSSPDYHIYATDTVVSSMIGLSASSYTTLCHAHLSLPCGVLPNLYLDQTAMNDETWVEWHTTATHRVHTGDTMEIDTTVTIDTTIIDTTIVPLYTDETFDTTYLTNPDIDTVGSSNLMPCNPYITSFTPTVVAAGVNDMLKIYGHNFGNRII